MRIRTGFSFHHSVGHLDEVADRLQALGYEYAPISDRRSTFGFTRWNELCQERGLKPVFGVELSAKRALSEPGVDYWTFFALDELRPLHDLVDWETRRKFLTYERALKQEGVIRIIGGHTNLDELPDELPENTFLGLGPSTPYGQLRRAVERGIPLIAVSDNRYPAPSDFQFYELALGRKAETHMYPQHILTAKEWFESLPRLVTKEMAREAWDRALSLMDRCSGIEMKRGALPHLDEDRDLATKCWDGADELGIAFHGGDEGDLIMPEEYRMRLYRELEVIREKGFEDYFHILADLVGWARARMQVGPARGSAAGSLVCYLLGITTLDPIKHDLLFERFIDINRPDLPDIDVDFPDTRRDEVFQYARERFGADRVARLGSVGTFGGKSAVNRIGQSLRIPAWKTNKLHGDIEEHGGTLAMQGLDTVRHGVEVALSNDTQRLLADYPKLQWAVRLAGHPEFAGQHAAGLLVTRDPVREYVAVNATSHGAMCDLKDAERLDLLKLDALGLTQLGIFENARDRIAERLETDVGPMDLNKLDWSDPEAFAILNDRKYSGIFQFTGNASRKLADDVTFETLEDMVAVTSLARPGPLASGGAQDWVDRRMGRAPVPPAIHPIVADITKDTLGILIFQEQTMRIVRELAGFSWGDTNKFRKAVSKKTGLEAFQEQFMAGATEHVTHAQADALWREMLEWGAYGFNRSHAVAYAMVGYQCCWLKAHYPLEFAAATLDAETDPDKQLQLLREMDAEGTSYVAVDRDRSTDRWEIDYDANRLVGPLTAIKGIGPAAVTEIAQARQRGAQPREALLKRLRGAETPIDSLYPVREAADALRKPEEYFPAEEGLASALSEVEPGRGREYIVEVKVTRIYEKNGNLHMFIADDTTECFAKIGKWLPELMASVRAQATVGKSLFAFKGKQPRNADFRMLDISEAVYLGDLK